MAMPHNHPSEHCWRVHKCRCVECCEIHEQRLARRRGQSVSRPAPTWRNPLPPDELARLRRAVGLQ